MRGLAASLETHLASEFAARTVTRTVTSVPRLLVRLVVFTDVVDVAQVMLIMMLIANLSRCMSEKQGNDAYLCTIGMMPIIQKQ